MRKVFIISILSILFLFILVNVLWQRNVVDKSCAVYSPTESTTFHKTVRGFPTTYWERLSSHVANDNRCTTDFDNSLVYVRWNYKNTALNFLTGIILSVAVGLVAKRLIRESSV